MRLRLFGLSPPRPWGCAVAHYAACSHAASLASLNSALVPPSVEAELLVLLPRRALSSAAVARAASTVVVACTSALAATSSTAASLAALAAVVAVAAAARYVPLPLRPWSPASVAHSRRPSAETVLQTWHANEGYCVAKRLPQMNCCSSV